MTDAQPATPLKTTPLHALHIELGARMVPFAGYDMPVQYPAGILKEHLHVRAAAGLFDVSHMGQFELRARSGRIDDAARALESVVPVDLVGLKGGRQRYALLTNDAGGIRDDLMIANCVDRFVIVANAACKDADEAYLRDALAAQCELVRRDDRALLALQGPQAEQVLAALAPDVAAMRFMDVRAVRIAGIDCTVSRSGYTGEDGFEISVPAGEADALARKLLADTRVAPIGLGARDSLRLEAGLCLYGSDLDPSTTPVGAALEWSIQASRRRGGTRAGGFPGAEAILAQLENGPARRRVGLRPDGRAPIRHGARLFRDAQGAEEIGVVTSGGFGPTVNAPVAMGYVAASAAATDGLIYAELRGAFVPVRVAPLPFVPTRYKR
ncbi:MAG: glycine cleavage system aminomethyltransferase GcvT [Pseudolabrys sp.]